MISTGNTLHRLRHILPIAALAVSATAAQAGGDAERGRVLAERWCTSCHVVADDVAGGTIGPAFSAMIHLRGRSEEQLKGRIIAPHDPMPDFNLSRREIDDIIAYIASLDG